MNELIKTLFGHRSIALLGFGREGRSSYNLFRKVFPQKIITIIDENDAIRNEAIFKNDTNLQFITGKGCMLSIDGFDVAIKSPGIPSHSLPNDLKKVHLTSQTDIFMQCYGHQSIGITGTKGKSTTSSLIFHILKNAGFDTMLVGNIGVPPFDCVEDIGNNSIIVMELSSHQLEYVSHSPHIAIVLNLFQEHLDHYHNYKEYQLAKLNIGKYQGETDYFIFNYDNITLRELLKSLNKPLHKPIAFSLEPEARVALKIFNNWIELNYNNSQISLYNIRPGQPLKGCHNMYNIMAAAASCFLCGVLPHHIDSGIRSFKGLEHRIELVGNFDGILWYNDSIATIPEATIEAVKTLQIVDTLILGGFDRGIEYGILYPFLNASGISNIIFVGEAGTRMMNEFNEYGVDKIKFYTATGYTQVVAIAREVTSKGMICLLSPAAASYDMFKNFEERGNVYKKNVRELDPSQE
jgi:UDP-N-acetylmuramoylalanine--D-glutamate ligase